MVSSRCREVDRLLARVHQHEAAGAVGGLGHAGLEAGLAEQRRLLVAGHPGDRQLGVEQARARSCRRCALLSRTSGSSARGTRNRRHSSSSQRCAWMSNSEVRLALVTSVAWTAPPVSRQSRKLSMVPKASSPRSARSRAPGRCRGSRRSWSPRNTDRAPARSGRGPGLRALGLELGAVVGGAAVLPDDRAVDRLAGRAVPDDGRLALVGDADGGDAPDVDPLLASASRTTASVSRQISSGSCSTQPRCGIMLRELALRRRRRPRLASRTRWRASRSCPDRSPGHDRPAPRADHTSRAPRRKGFSFSVHAAIRAPHGCDCKSPF